MPAWQKDTGGVAGIMLCRDKGTLPWTPVMLVLDDGQLTSHSSSTSQEMTACLVALKTTWDVFEPPGNFVPMPEGEAKISLDHRTALMELLVEQGFTLLEEAKVGPCPH